MRNLKIIDRILDVTLKNDIGDFKIGAYKFFNGKEIFEAYIIYKNSIEKIEYVRLNSACFTGDLFGCNRCDCNEQMKNAIKLFQQKGNGILIYALNQEGRGVGAVDKLKTLKLMSNEGVSTKEAFEILEFPVDSRDYMIFTMILKDLNINNIKIITNNPDKIKFLNDNGITVIERVSSVSQNSNVKEYLYTKKRDFGHLI